MIGPETKPTEGTAKRKLPSPATAPTASIALTAPGGFPFQFRLPKAPPRGGRGEVDPWWQLNRAAWNSLVLATEANGYRPPVRSVVLKKRGAMRGLRAISFLSAKEYFDKLHAEQGTAEPQPAGGVQ
ncbi:MAG: hypothetical protein ABMA26_15300 [Limisphaerales bacterium]